MEKKHFIFLLVLTIFAILIEGYKFGDENHTNYLSLARAKIDNTLYTKDFYIQNIEYPAYFYDILVRFSGNRIEEISFFLYFLLLYFTFIMIFKMAELLFWDKYASYLSVLFFLIPKLLIGSTNTRDYILYHTTFVLPFLLLAIYLFLRKKYIWSFIILGFSSNFHGMSSLFVLAMFLFYFLFNFKKINKSKIVLSFLSFFIFSIPFLKNILERKESLIPNSLWIEIVKTRAGHHFFPLNWSWPIWIYGFALYIILFLIAYKFRVKNRENYNKSILIFSFAILIMLLVGFIFVEILPVKSIIQMHFFRSFSFFVIFTILYASNFIVILLKENNFYKNLFVIILGTILFYSGNFKIFIILLVFIAGIFMILSYYKKSKRFETILACAVLIFLILCSIGANLWKGKDHINLPFVEERDEWYSLELWSKENTEKDALFVTRYDKHFRFYSERSIFVTNKDLGLGIVFSPSGEKLIPEYLKRLNLIGCNYLKEDTNTCIKNYDTLSKEDILRIKEEYDIDYIIFDKPKKLDLDIVYENNKFIIFSI